MNSFLVFSEYLLWQYSSGIAEFLRAWANIQWFLFYFFSFGMLSRTLFQPLFRIKEEYGRHFDLQKAAEALTINIIMRITGFIVRVFLLCIGLIAECVAFIICFAAFIIYLISP